MIRRIALYAIRFSASKGKNGKDFSVFFSMRLRVSRHSSICLILYFYFFHSQKRTHRDSIPFKEGAKEKESLQEFFVEKSPSFEREREGRKNRPAPYILDKQWNNRINGNRRCSRLSARVACRGQATSPVFFIRKKRHLHPSWAQALRKQILLGKKHRVTSLYDSRNAHELELRRRGRKSDKKAEGGRDTYH